MAFGYGVHGCAGQGLARIEGKALVETLIANIDSLALDGTPVLHENPVARGLAHLPVSVVR